MEISTSRGSSNQLPVAHGVIPQATPTQAFYIYGIAALTDSLDAMRHAPDQLNTAAGRVARQFEAQARLMKS